MQTRAPRVIDSSPIAAWLRKWVKTQVTLSWLGGSGAVLAGCAILLLTWGLVYVVSLFALGPWLGFHHWIHSVAGLFLIPALFWGNSRTSRDYLSEYSVSVGTTSETVVNFYLPGVGLVSNINPLAPGTMHAGVKMITDCLYAGPRVVLSGFQMFGRINVFRNFDVEGCASVLGALFVACRKMPFQEIMESVAGIDPTIVFAQMQTIEGVVFLSADPAGLALTRELRATIQSLFQ
jgi:hypothetical protein